MQAGRQGGDFWESVYIAFEVEILALLDGIDLIPFVNICSSTISNAPDICHCTTLSQV
jgi:hypothetical protein